MPAVPTTHQHPRFLFQIFVKSKKLIVEMAQKPSASCGALPISMTCDPTAAISSIYTWDSDSLLSFPVITDPHQGWRHYGHLSDLLTLLLFLPLEWGLGGWKWQGCDRGDSLYIVGSHYLHLSISRHNDRRPGPILKWVGGCLEGGELWQKNISRV